MGLGVIMLGMGMTLTFRDFREVLKMPKWVALGVGAQFLIMPLIGWSVATLFALPDQFKLGIILVSCCPGVTASNVVTYLAKGNLALSVMMTMMNPTLMVITMYICSKGIILERLSLLLLCHSSLNGKKNLQQRLTYLT